LKAIAGLKGDADHKKMLPAMYQLAMIYLKQRRFTKSRAWLMAALRWMKIHHLKSPDFTGNILRKILRLAYINKDKRMGGVCLSALLFLWEKQEQRDKAYGMAREIGLTYWKQQKLLLARRYLIKALRLYGWPERKNWRLLGDIVSLGGLGKRRSGGERKVLYALLDHEKNHLARAFAYETLGLYFENTGRVEMAIKSYWLSLHYHKNLEDPGFLTHITNILNHLGGLYQRQGEWSRAKYCLSTFSRYSPLNS